MPDDLPDLKPVGTYTRKPTLPYNEPVTIPVTICTKPSRSDIIKMGLYRFGRGFVANALATATALGATGIRGIELLVGTIAGGLLGGFGLGVDKVIREVKNGKNYRSAVSVETATRVVTGGEPMIRDEVMQLAAELAGLGGILLDDTPNKEQLGAILESVFGVVKEGTDFASVPKEERAKAIIHAFVIAGSAIADKAINYSDDQPV